MTRGRAHRRGAVGDAFTLIEAIAAIVVLSVAVPAMLLVAQEAQGGRASTVLACRARWLATEKLEEIIADRHSSTRGYAYLQASNYPAEASVPGFAGFARAVALVQTGPDLASAGTGYCRVTVTVSWTDGRAQARSLALATVLTDYTP